MKGRGCYDHNCGGCGCKRGEGQGRRHQYNEQGAWHQLNAPQHQ